MFTPFKENFKIVLDKSTEIADDIVMTNVLNQSIVNPEIYGTAPHLQVRSSNVHVDSGRSHLKQIAKAHYAVSKAIREGTLIRPGFCQECHKECKPNGHHPDYKEPLVVEWLCTGCHGQAHSHGRFLDRIRRKESRIGLFGKVRMDALGYYRKLGKTNFMRY